MANILFIVEVLLFISFTLQLYCWIKAIRKRKYNKEDLYFSLKRWWAECCINVKKKQERNLHNSENDVLENYKTKHEDISFYGTDQKGNSLFLKFSHKKFKLAEVSLQLTTSDGQIYVLPDYPDTTIVSGLNQEWTAGGLKIEFLQFQQRWRIVYNGMLRNLARGDECSDDNIEHVRLNFLFIVNTHPLRWPEDWSTKLHGEILAREPFSFKWLDKIKSFDNTGFDQMGSMLGQVTYKDASISTMYLRGLYQHRWGEDQFRESVTLFVVTPLGTICYLGVGSTKHSFSQLQFGQFRHSDDEVYEIEEMNFKLSDFTKEKLHVNSVHKVSFQANGKEYNIVIRSDKDPITLYYGEPRNRSNTIATVNLEVNGKQGTGLIQLWSPYSGSYRTKGPKQLQFLKQPTTLAQKSDYVLYFNDKKCEDESIVGGKGFSLAVLTSIEDVEYAVPRGFCVTVFALELQLSTYKELQKVINDIVDISVGKKDGDLRKQCDDAMSIIQSTPLVDKVKNAVLKAMQSLESSGDDDKSPRYAIRSSAVGEDSEETSAAGQNSTYLGVQGADNVIKSIAMCWASLFSYQSVQYRKQHGMPLKASMGVCVQEMVNPDAAGVMFTRHPTTGDPSTILITANYGLGETVVSAAVEPDTIVVHKSWDNKLTVKSSTAGNKKEKILASGNGVVTIKLNDKESKSVCLTDKIALRLAAIGINLETLFGSSKDIEWAVVDEQIYLLQARPITTLYTWTDFELTHELGSGVPSDIDFNVFSNVGEVLPYPMAPLSISIFPKILDTNLNVQLGTKNQVCMNIFGMRSSLNYYGTFLRFPPKQIGFMNKIMDVAFCGKIIITSELHRTACERNGIATAKFQMYMTLKVIKEMIQNSKIERYMKKVYKNITLKAEDFHTAHGLYNEIIQNLHHLNPVFAIHSRASTVSINFESFAMILLTSGYTDFVPEHFSDIGLLLSCCSDIVGVELVMSLKKIITYIRQDNKDEEFKKVEPIKGVDWLKINCPPAAKELDNFIKEHGHRCIQEMDLISEPWALKPENLITTLQTMISSPETSNVSKTPTVEETVAALKTPKSTVSKWLLRKITPSCKTAVKYRELTKSALVNAVHTFRLAFRRLGKLMVLEEYLPSEDLIFFLTIKEIGEMLRHRKSTLIQKAIRRKRLYPKLKELEYLEFNTGMPLPIKKSLDVPLSDGNIKIEGTPVCSGSILGRACVITDVSEANTIQNDDILITRCTDIAWSPYFSLLSGIVTELGGLISHGAVIAREYGLPCIISARGATQLFQTGDTVLLNADTGTLQLVERHK